LPALIVLVCLGEAEVAHSSSFTTGVTLKLCAYEGSSLQTPCTNDNVFPGDDADMTLILTTGANNIAPSTVVTFIPAAASIPGPETNAWCANAVDDDGDTVVNDGCSTIGEEPETQRCLNANDDDPLDDALPGATVTNDGCPVAGSLPENDGMGHCLNNYIDDDPANDGYPTPPRVNDGCYPGGEGSVQVEGGALCDNATSDDMRDDAVGGGQKVNDGCPTVGASAESGAQCDNASNDDPADDTKVNDGCYPGGFGGAEPELNECDGATDDDVDGYANDGCPAVGGPPIGGVVGEMYVASTAGLLGLECDEAMTASMKLLNGTTDNSLPSMIYSLPAGGSSYEGLLEPFRDDGNTNYVPQHADRYPAHLNKVFDPDRVGDINNDGDEFDTVGGVAENPGASLTDLYGSVEPLRPLARYSAAFPPGGGISEAQLVELLVFNPGALAGFAPPHPLSDLGSSALGYPMVAVVNDATAPVAPGSVTDSCTPTETRIVLWGSSRDNNCTKSAPPYPCSNDDVPCPDCGNNTMINAPSAAATSGCSAYDEGGCVRQTNPPSTATGTHLYYVYQQSTRDQDGDGYENAFDTCPFATNVENPRSSTGPDGDMIDSVCDPSPTVDTGGEGNHDGDVAASDEEWINSQDNCPVNGNGDQKEGELITKWSLAAPRGGSRADSIGDACESNDTVANGHFHSTWTVIAKCIGATDTDGDGWCNSDETAWGSCSANPCAAQYTGTGCPNCAALSTPEHYDLFVPLGLTHSGSGANPPEREPKQVCNDSADNDKDGYTDSLDPWGSSWGCGGVNLLVHPDFPTCPSQGCPGIDTDGDGVTDEAEVSIGTDALGRCGAGGFLQDPPSTDWPLDFTHGGTPNSTDLITITDQTSFLAPIRRLDTYPGHPDFDPRWDLIPGTGGFGTNWIQISDLTALHAGPSGYPPMTNGAKVYGSTSPCTPHPVYGD
jgi:hypothetical protein